MTSLAQKQPSPRVLTPHGSRWYVYGHTTIDANGKKSPIIPIRKKIPNWRSRTHIQTVMMAADGSELLYGIPLDLDFDRADDRWKKRGKLDHKSMADFLFETYPTLAKYLCTWTRSTGGKGLGVILFHDPILKTERAWKAIFLAERVQRLMIEVLSFHGMGCDPKALGISRPTPNWRNGRILLRKDDITIRRVQRDNERHQVLTHVYNELRRSKAFKSLTKKEGVATGLRFAVKEEADAGLSKIYSHVLDLEPETLTLRSSYEELAAISKLSIPTLRRYLPKSSWLEIKASYGEGLTLKLKPTSELSEHVYGERLERVKPSSKMAVGADWDLCAPEEVMDGDRNGYIWMKAVLLRNQGVDLEEAISSMRGLVSRIPGARSSRNCRRFENIVVSIYRHARVDRKSKRTIYPLEALTKSQSYCPDPTEPMRESAPSKPVESKPESQQLLAMVSIFGKKEFISPKQGGAGDLPPTTRPQETGTAELPGLADRPDAEVRAWVNSFFSEKRMNLRSSHMNSGKVLKMEAPAMPGLIDQKGSTGPRVFRTLRAARAAVSADRHPIDRLARVIKRLENRASDEEILVVLQEEHVRLCETKDRGLHYKPREGKFKRMAEAWAWVKPNHRREFLAED